MRLLFSKQGRGALRLLAGAKKTHLRALVSKARYPNRQAVERKYKTAYGRLPDLDNPRLFSEKIQWIKLFYNDPLYSICSDKFLAREYVRSKGLEDILVNLTGVYDRGADIDFASLPDKFVIKATHGCGWNFICDDKTEEAAYWKTRVRMFDEWLRQDFSLYSRELHYSRIRPRLVCEQYLENSDGTGVRDFKFFCFNGEPRLIQVDYDRHTGHRRNYYDTDWNLTDIKWEQRDTYPQADDRPANLAGMLDIARRLSEDFFHARIDLYNVDGRVYFGEITFTDGSGFIKLKPDTADALLGSWMELPEESPYVVK